MELFEREFIFGDFCSFGGIETKGHKCIVKIVNSKDLSSLKKWLSSTNTEKQLFGFLGLYMLQKKDINQQMRN